VIHLYGVAEDLEGLPDVAGLEEAPLERRRVEGLDLVISRVGVDLPELSTGAVLRHAEVVEEILSRSRSMLPAQFGRAFADEEELARTVRAKAPELRRSLSRVSGCVEFGLRVVGSENGSGNGPAAGSGRDYMRARLADEKQRERLSSELHEPLTHLSRESAKFSSGPSELLVSAYLVPFADAEGFGGRMRQLETEHPELTLVCTGPWPPYTFAGELQGEQG
jgi:hypothetical protein